MKSLTVLGSTGTIGTQALDVVRNNGWKISGLTANSSVEKLATQAREFNPQAVAIADSSKESDLKNALFGTGIKVFSGEDGVCRVAAMQGADTVLNAIVGIAGLRPTVSSICKGRRIALANKETLVTGGEIIMKMISDNNVELLPVDSEHSAIYQSLVGSCHGEIKKILLTASGGPFFGKTLDELKNVTPAQALRHPNWSMGRKITIDSATMMNKGLEVIEAVHLFGVSADDIEVVVHRQSILHSAVEFVDGAVIAQLGTPDMKLPIQYALTYPNRINSNEKKLNLFDIGKLTFEKPDLETFSCLATCIDAIKTGGLKPVAVNGANEAAVDLFLNEKISFLQIGELVKKAMDNQPNVSSFGLDDIFSADKSAREFVYSQI